MELLQSLDLGTILTVIVAAVATFFGGTWLKGKVKIKQTAVLAFDVYDLINEFEKALSDNKIDKDEIATIKGKAGKIKTDFRLLINKK